MDEKDKAAEDMRIGTELIIRTSAPGGSTGVDDT